MCHFCVSEVHYVGHVLSSDGIKPDLQKVEAINTIPIPANCKELQSFLGVVTYLSKLSSFQTCPRKPLHCTSCSRMMLTPKNWRLSLLMQVQKVWVLSFYRMTALWRGGFKGPNSEPAKLRTDRERDAGYSLWLRILETDHKPLETILKKPIIKHPSICKRDPQNEALCSQRQIHTMQSTYSRRYALQSLLIY